MYTKILDLFHNIYSLFYCTNVVFYTFYLIEDNNINMTIYKNIFDYSMFYFSTSILLNYFEKNYLYILHHLICIINLSIIYFDDDVNLIRWVNTCLLAEVSTLFLSLSKVIKFYTDKQKKKNIFNKIKKISDCMFALSYLVIRIGYLLPFTINFLYYYEYKYVLIEILVVLSSIVMFSMNIYWSGKIINIINQKN